MARSPRRITRRDIRQPDRFVTFAGKVLEFVNRKRTFFIGLGALVIAALGVIWGWDMYAERQNRVAARYYARAVDAYHAGKYREAANLFAQVKGYSLSSYSRPALLYEARAYLGLNDAAKAAASLQELLQKERKSTFLRQLALVNLAYIEEQAGNCKEATRHFAEAEKIPGPVTDDALLGKARCALKAHDLNGALEAYRQYLALYPQADKTVQVTLAVQQLDQQISTKVSRK